MIDAEKDLNVLLDLMTRYPEMIIELSSHTDYRGNGAYNKSLSQRRAESATNWLLAKGVPSNRIIPKGYGEGVPATVAGDQVAEYPYLQSGWVLTEDFIKALPTDQREGAHQVNRRTEFKIIEGPTTILIKRMEKRLKEAPKKVAEPKPKPAPKKTTCLLYTSPSPRDRQKSRMPSSA